MFDVDTFRSVIVKGLKEYLKIPIIRSNQTGEPPKYPYGSYTITTLASENGGTWGRYEDGKERKPFTLSLSFTIQSNNAAEAMTLTLKAHEWFDHVGRVYLNDNNIIVQSVGNVSNRDNFLTIEYEYRHGFDVVFWVLSEVTDTAEETGYIEFVKVNDDFVEPATSTEELIERLEKRLDGDT